MALKNELRKEYKLKRGSLDESFREEASQKICASILSLDCIRNAKTVMSYNAINTEVSLDLFMTKVHGKKTLLLPVTDTSTQTMHASKLLHLDKTELGGYGILEPETKDVFDPLEIDVVIVPALVYNRRGFRIGYGKGYYDKFFSSCKNAIKIGAAFSCQLCDEHFEEDFDISVDIIVTENEIIYCKRGK